VALVELDRDADVRLGPRRQIDTDRIEGHLGWERLLPTMSRSEEAGLEGHARDLCPGVGDGEAACRLSAPGPREVEGESDVRVLGRRIVDVLAGRDVEYPLA
jgi:hypothetical protein